MSTTCKRFISPAMQYGKSCAVCGYLEAAHRSDAADEAPHSPKGKGELVHTYSSHRTRTKSGNQQRRKAQHQKSEGYQTSHLHSTREAQESHEIHDSKTHIEESSNLRTKELSSLNLSAEGPATHSLRDTSRSRKKETNGFDRTQERRDLIHSVGAGHSYPKPSTNTHHSRRIKNGHNTTKHVALGGDDTLKSTIDKQANLLALAADAARHNGDTVSAQTLYTESADAVMDRLRLDVAQLKTSSRRTATRAPPLAGHSGSPRNRRDWGEWYSNSEINSARSTDRESTMSHEGWAGAVAGYSKQRRNSRSGRKAYLDTSDGDAFGARHRSSQQQEEPVERSLLSSAGYGSREKEKLSQLFGRHTNGAPALTRSAFAQLLGSIGCPGDSDAYFSAFDRKRKRTWVDHTDFFLGCAALDPNTPHSGKWKEERIKYIFRYYAEDGVKLTRDQFYDVVEHLTYVANDDPTRFVDAGERVFSKRSSMTFSEFNAACAQGPRGIGSLFRFNILNRA